MLLVYIMCVLENDRYAQGRIWVQPCEIWLCFPKIIEIFLYSLVYRFPNICKKKNLLQTFKKIVSDPQNFRSDSGYASCCAQSTRIIMIKTKINQPNILFGSECERIADVNLKRSHPFQSC